MNFDERLRHEVMAETPDASGVVSAVRAQIERDGQRRLWLQIAAAVMLTAGAGAAWQATRPTHPRLLEAAARDHRVEVVENKPRRWKLDVPAMQPLMAQYHVGWNDVQALLPVGFVLEKAKECRIGGQPTLHMVFSDGNRALSVYVRASGEDMKVEQVSVQDADVAAFHRGKLSGIVVAANAPGLCAEAVRRLTSL